jgi:hypothetical protein
MPRHARVGDRVRVPRVTFLLPTIAGFFTLRWPRAQGYA